jgi:hypothetical protein
VKKRDDLSNLRSRLEERGLLEKAFPATCTGEEHTSPFSGISYIYCESIFYFGHPEIESEYQILYHSESDIHLVFDKTEYRIPTRRIRPYLERSYECTIPRSSENSKENRYAFHREIVIDIMNQAKGDLLLVEYGLNDKRVYHALFDEEVYWLPPGRKRDEPVKRMNRVLLISDRPFDRGKPKGILTPFFRDFSY